MDKWTQENMPSQRGRTAVVTGTGGLGYEDALALAKAGADVVLAGRNAGRGAEAVTRLKDAVPGAKVRFDPLDLADLGSVKAFADRLATQQDSLDLLINNAGVMVPSQRHQTKDGFELQLGTNHLGHFALTAWLLPLLRKGHEARVVTLSSVAARSGQINFADLQAEQAYVPMKAYGQSKLACLMFAREMQRRSAAGNWGVASLGAHPGISRTDLLHNAPGRFSPSGLARSYLWFLFQPAWQGALPTLFAATDSLAVPGGYYGPHALGETRGYPTVARVPVQAEDTGVAQRLWRVSEELTGAAFPA